MKNRLLILMASLFVVVGCASHPASPSPAPVPNPPLPQNPQQVQLTGALYTTIVPSVIGIGVAAALIYLTFFKLGVAVIIGCAAEIVAALAVVEEIKYAKYIALTLNISVCVLIVGALAYAVYWIVQAIKAKTTNNPTLLAHPTVCAILARFEKSLKRQGQPFFQPAKV